MRRTCTRLGFTDLLDIPMSLDVQLLADGVDSCGVRGDRESTYITIYTHISIARYFCSVPSDALRVQCSVHIPPERLCCTSAR